MDDKEFDEIKKLLQESGLSKTDEQDEQEDETDIIIDENPADQNAVYIDDTSEDYTDIDNEDENINEEPDKKSLLYEIFEWVESIAISVVLVVLLFTFVFRVVMVDGNSMLNTLHDQDRVTISNFLYTPKANDIVVFVPDIENYENKPFVKRVIATEGQTVSVDAEKGKVYINGVEIEETFIRETLVKQGDQKYPLTVPEGHIFVMGDNRNDSWDSRFSAVGTVDVRSVLGKVIYRVFPFSKIGTLK